MGKLQALGLVNVEETARQNRELDEAKKAGRRSMIRQLRNAKEEREAAADVSDTDLDEFDAGLPEFEGASDVEETAPEDFDDNSETDTLGDGTDVETDLDGDGSDATDETLADELGEGSSSADETAGNVTGPVPPAVGNDNINDDSGEESDEA
jgi:hypothetical protein